MNNDTLGMKMEKLPRSVQEIADVIGRERALYLVGMLPRCFMQDRRKRETNVGGRAERVILYVPKNLKPDHVLVRILGWHDAELLVRHFGGELLMPANCRPVYRNFRDAGIRKLAAEGTPVAMIADWFRVSERHVKNVLAENPQEDCGPLRSDNRANLSARASPP